MTATRRLAAILRPTCRSLAPDGQDTAGKGAVTCTRMIGVVVSGVQRKVRTRPLILGSSNEEAASKRMDSLLLI
jgi:hypothetical protein